MFPDRKVCFRIIYKVTRDIMKSFFNSSRSGLLRRFFWVEYLETPFECLVKFDRHSVHSRVIKIRVPLFFAIKFKLNNFKYYNA